MMERKIAKLLDKVDSKMEHGEQEIAVKMHEVESILSDLDVFIERLESSGYEVIKHNVPKSSWGCMNHTVLTVCYE